MGRRYYCDYCDKTFIDDVDARKKHIFSTFHQRLVNEHYLNWRDPKTILKEEIVKQPCRRFLQNGSCQFTGICKYTHYNQDELWMVKTIVDEIEMQEQQDKENSTEIPTLEPWLEEYNKKKSVNSKKEDNVASIWWNYPEKLEMRADLPPSLIKFKPEHFSDDKFETWG